MICDVSKHQGEIDWGQLGLNLEFVVIKASGKYSNGADPYFAANVAGAQRMNVPFHVFHFLYCLTETEARRDAGLFYRTVRGQGVWPLFWVLDCEAGWGVEDKLARPLADAFEAELRRLARLEGHEIRVALYVANEKYSHWKLDYAHYAYVWIPAYRTAPPDHPCDMWQYTSKGRLPGISGNVDLDRLTGTKPLSFFTTGPDAPAAAGDGSEESSKGCEQHMLTGKQLAAYCENVFADGWVYWYGTYGKKCSKSLYESKKKQYPNHYTSDRTSGYMADIAAGKRCADCVGMIKSFFWTGGKFGAEPVYASNHCPDKSANGMIALCPQTGPIKSIPDEPGLVVWKDGHIGVYVGGGYTVEMKGFSYDCRRNKVKDGPWTKWGRLPESMISYDPEACDACDIPEAPQGERTLRNGCEGEDVRELQSALISLGFSCGKYGADGEFGDCTEQAVEAFQRAHALPITGIYDGDTRVALEAAQDAAYARQQELAAAKPRFVRVTGGSVYVRTAPDTSTGKKLGVVHEGDRLAYQGQVSPAGWFLVEYLGRNAWISGKYAAYSE